MNSEPYMYLLSLRCTYIDMCWWLLQMQFSPEDHIHWFEEIGISWNLGRLNCIKRYSLYCVVLRPQKRNTLQKVGKVNYSPYRCEVNLVFRTSGLIRICLIRHMAKFGNSKPISGLYIFSILSCVQSLWTQTVFKWFRIQFIFWNLWKTCSIFLFISISQIHTSYLFT